MFRPHLVLVLGQLYPGISSGLEFLVPLFRTTLVLI